MVAVGDLLTQRELTSLLEIQYHAVRVTSDTELKGLLLCVGHLVPSDYIVTCLGRTDSHGQFLEFLRLINCSYPTDWLDRYEKNKLAQIDPILQSNFGCFKTQIWSETIQQVASPPQCVKHFMEEARGCGLSEGITIGMAARRHAAGSLFSFSGQLINENIRHAIVLEYLVPHLHLALMRASYHPKVIAPVITKREREILQWLREGKTNWEIGQILGISERTVKFHIQNLSSKLDASNRSHIVALAMSLGLIAG